MMRKTASSHIAAGLFATALFAFIPTPAQAQAAESSAWLEPPSATHAIRPPRRLPSPGPDFHFDTEASVGYAWMGFLSSQTWGLPCIAEGCNPQEQNAVVLTGTAALDMGDAAIEGSYSRSISGARHESVSAGLRLDTGKSFLTFIVRLGWVYQLGDFEGHGFRSSSALVLQPFSWLGIFADARLDLTAVPGWMSARGTLLSYSAVMSAGIRLTL